MGESILVSTLAGLATGVGAILVVLFGRPSRRFLSAMLGLAAGVMLAVSVFELLPEAAELGNSLTTVSGFVIGAALMALLDMLLPHVHSDLETQEGGHADQPRDNGRPRGFNLGQAGGMMRCGLLLSIGIALHNLPEGLALHNIPEGMAMATPLALAGVNKWLVIAIATFAGLMTPVGTFIGAALISISPEFIGMSMAIAAGAMIYIVSDELIPQSHEYHNHMANLGLMAGFVLGYML